MQDNTTALFIPQLVRKSTHLNAQTLRSRHTGCNKGGAYVVEEESVVRPINSLVQVSIGTDDAGRLAAKLQRHWDDVVGRSAHDDLAHLRAARERHLGSHEGVLLGAGYMSLDHNIGQARPGIWSRHYGKEMPQPAEESG